MRQRVAGVDECFDVTVFREPVADYVNGQSHSSCRGPTANSAAWQKTCINVGCTTRQRHASKTHPVRGVVALFVSHPTLTASRYSWQMPPCVCIFLALQSNTDTPRMPRTLACHRAIRELIAFRLFFRLSRLLNLRLFFSYRLWDGRQSGHWLARNALRFVECRGAESTRYRRRWQSRYRLVIRRLESH